MKICLLGSTGRVGQKMLSLLVESSYDISVLVRDLDKWKGISSSHIHVVEGNARNLSDIQQAIKGCDTVVSALSTDGDDTLSVSTRLLIQAMKEEGITRIVTIGTAGILQSRSEPDILRYQSSESKRKLTRAAEEHHLVYKALAESQLDWTIVCPAYLPDGEAAGHYRTEIDFLPADGTSISTGDTSEFAYHVLMSGLYSKKRVGIAY